MQARVGPTRAPRTDGVPGYAIGLDEVLLAHHGRLCLEHRVAVVRRVLQRVFKRRVAFAQAGQIQKRRGSGKIAFGRPLYVPPARAAKAFDREQPPVPAFGRRKGTWGRLGGRVMQDRALIDAAIDRARLDAHDKRHCHSQYEESSNSSGIPPASE